MSDLAKRGFTVYYIADWYREIKDQLGIEDETGAAILAAAVEHWNDETQ